MNLVEHLRVPLGTGRVTRLDPLLPILEDVGDGSPAAVQGDLEDLLSRDRLRDRGKRTKHVVVLARSPRDIPHRSEATVVYSLDEDDLANVSGPRTDPLSDQRSGAPDPSTILLRHRFRLGQRDIRRERHAGEAGVICLLLVRELDGMPYHGQPQERHGDEHSKDFTQHGCLLNERACRHWHTSIMHLYFICVNGTPCPFGVSRLTRLPW